MDNRRLLQLQLLLPRPRERLMLPCGKNPSNRSNPPLGTVCRRRYNHICWAVSLFIAELHESQFKIWRIPPFVSLFQPWLLSPVEDGRERNVIANSLQYSSDDQLHTWNHSPICRVDLRTLSSLLLSIWVDRDSSPLCLRSSVARIVFSAENWNEWNAGARGGE